MCGRVKSVITRIRIGAPVAHARIGLHELIGEIFELVSHVVREITGLDLLLGFEESFLIGVRGVYFSLSC